MPVTVVPHENLEDLLGALLRELPTAFSRPRPLPVVVPSVAFSDWLQLRIAERRGVCMGLDFLTPQTLIARALHGYVEAPEDPWSPERLTWRLLGHLDDVAPRLGLTDPGARDRFALARAIADRFDQYAHFRPEMVLRWARGGTGDEREDWQRELWRKLHAEIGGDHRVERVARLGADPAFRDELARRFPRVLVLGTGALDPLLVDMLGLLAEAGGQVSARVVLPSREFLGDLRRRGALPSSTEEFEPASGHPLLVSMGRHAVGTFLLLGRLDEQYAGWPEPGPAPASASGATLLERLQADVRALCRPERRAVSRGDISVRVHSCFGPRREMEALRDELLRAFRDLPDLRPEEIHIVTPDLDAYAPLVNATLEHEGMPLPVRLTELAANSRPPVIEGWLALLDMARAARGTASELLELLQLGAVQGALGIEQDDAALERVRGWIEQSGLTQGIADAAGVEPGSWTFARDRLVAGRWFGAAEGAVYGSGDYVLPVTDLLFGERALEDRFLSWHATLETTLRTWRDEATAAEWAERLDLAAASLVAGDPDESSSAQAAVRFLASVEGGATVDAGALRDWLSAAAPELTRRAAVSGRMTFGRFKQLQHLPCRVLAMVGMQDDKFPSRTRAPGWDLLQLEPRLWDRDPRSDDRQLFLDAVLTPADRLIITGSTRNVRTRETEPFSSCVDELLRVAENMGGEREALVVAHRLQPHATEYFRGNDRGSFDVGRLEVARRFLPGAERQPLPSWNEPAAGEIPATLTLEDLERFWRDPAAAYLRAMGLGLPREEGDETELDEPPLTMDGLGRWSVRTEIVSEIVHRDERLDWLRASLAANRQLPPGRLGRETWEKLKDESVPLGTAVRDCVGSSVLREVDLGDVRVRGSVTLSRDESFVLAFRVGKLEDRNELAPWLQAVFAAAAGSAVPAHIFDDGHKTEPRVLPGPDPEQAREVMRALVAGFAAGQGRPLGFAPTTSRAIASALIADEGDRAAALRAGRQAWEDEGGFGRSAGEGHGRAARLAWRDREPFLEVEDWLHWASAVAVPWRKWSGA